ncbi:sulfatase [Ferrimonas pelagia]|uniref:Sulfatase n=1 Tax=Ferrimonas pelagia TaxID=1177826 RepID=A0ABP9EKZ2_9GAMM
MRTLPALTVGAALCASLMAPAVHAQPTTEGLNFIVIYTDDQGYNDLGSYGSPYIRTPHLDKMADEGIRFTDFYVMSGKCSPSRAALLTGSYPRRVSMQYRVVMDRDKHGLHPDEVTIAKQLKKAGYRTSLIGKWHLGHAEPALLPLNQGFDSFFGLPYSNDMKLSPLLTLSPDYVRRPDDAPGVHFQKRGNPQGVLMEGNEVIEYPTDQSMLTQRLTERAIDFITQDSNDPFFLYLAHPMPHVPVDASPAFKGKSAFGPYGDAVEELDWSVGEILNTLKAHDLADNTVVVYASDNGPWGYGEAPDARVGRADPLRGSKGSQYEGGFRVPALIWAPKFIAPKVHEGIVSNMDLLPTFSKLAGVPLPADRPIDGVDIWPLLTSPDTQVSSHEAIYFYESRHGTMAGVRWEDWKYLEIAEERNGPKVPQLYNLKTDIAESNNLISKHPERAATMKAMMARFDARMEQEARPHFVSQQ